MATRKRTKLATMLGFTSAGDNRLIFLAECACRWQELGRLPEAKATYEALRLLAPQDPLPHLGLCEIQLAIHDYGDACRTAYVALDADHLGPATMAYAYFLLGQALYGLKRRDESSEAVRRARYLDPTGFGRAIPGELLEVNRSKPEPALVSRITELGKSWSRQ